MGFSLTAEQRAELSVYVDRGDYASVEEAARNLIDEHLAERALGETDDLAWAKPYVDEALAEAARGKVMSHEEYRASIDRRLAALKG